MPVELFEELGDEIGPELVAHLYDPSTGMKGVVVADAMFLGITAGGVRMLPNISTIEIARLARAMTYKFAIHDMPIGGGKAGIWHDPTAPDKDEILKAFGHALKPLMEKWLYYPGADMGTSNRDIKLVFEAAGVEQHQSGLALKVKEGMPLEDHLTGFGVTVAANAASEFADVSMEGATVAIEGFGKVGGGVAKYTERAGAKVVAISTIRGAIYNPRGLDVEKLLEMRKRYGDEIVLRYSDARKIEKKDLFSLPVDILVPGARPDVIDENNARQIKAKLISPGANIPVTREAEEILFKKGIISIPDFVANSGGILAGTMDLQGASEKQAFETIKEKITSVTKEVISTSLEEKINPKEMASKIARERVMKAKRNKKGQSVRR